MAHQGHAIEDLVPTVNILDQHTTTADRTGEDGSEYELSRLDTKQTRLTDHEIGSSVRDSSPMRRIDTSQRGRDATGTDLGSSELAPVDGGRQAWLFVAAAFVLETTIWGYSFTFGIVQVYLHSHPPFDKNSLVSAPARARFASQRGTTG